MHVRPLTWNGDSTDANAERQEDDSHDAIIDESKGEEEGSFCAIA